MKYKMVELGTLISQAKTVRCGDGDYPVLSMTMHDGLVFQDDKFKKVIASKDRSDYKVVYRNQLVISFPIDEGVLAAQRIVDAGIVSPAYGIWDIDQEKILPEFLEYVLRCERSLSYYKAKLRGSTARRRSLPTPTLLAHMIPIPSLEEQAAILEIIHKASNIVASREQELDKLDELIKARFVELFGDPNIEFRFESHKFKEYASDMTKGPFGSDMKKDLYVPKGEDTYKVYIQINAIQGNQNLGDYYISKEYFEQKISRFEVHPGDFIITCDGTLGKHLKLDENMERGVISPSLLRITLDESRMTQEYFEYMWDMYMLLLMKKEARNACLVHLPSAKVIGEVEIPVAPFELQKEFSAFVKQLDKSKVVIQKSLEKTQLLFDSLMQEYFG